MVLGYKTGASAKAAVKRQALHLMNYEIRPAPDGRFVAHFFCAVHEDVDEVTVRSSGFTSEFNPEKAV